MMRLAMVLRFHGFAFCFGLLMCGFAVYGMVTQEQPPPELSSMPFEPVVSHGKLLWLLRFSLVGGLCTALWAWRQGSKLAR